MGLDSAASRMLAAASGPVAEAVAGAIPGAVLGVVTRAGDRAAKRSATRRPSRPRRRCSRETWFDLASLTKVLFTTPAILRLVAAGADRAG